MDVPYPAAEKPIPSISKFTGVDLKDPLNLFRAGLESQLDYMKSLKTSTQFSLFERLKVEMSNRAVTEYEKQVTSLIPGTDVLISVFQPHEVQTVANEQPQEQAASSKKKKRTDNFPSDDSQPQKKMKTGSLHSSSVQLAEFSPITFENLHQRSIKEEPIPVRLESAGKNLNALVKSNSKLKGQQNPSEATPKKKAAHPFSLYAKSKPNASINKRSQSPLKRILEGASHFFTNVAEKLGFSQEKKRRNSSDDRKAKAIRNSTSFKPARYNLPMQESDMNLPNIKESLSERLERKTAQLRQTISLVEETVDQQYKSDASLKCFEVAAQKIGKNLGALDREPQKSIQKPQTVNLDLLMSPEGLNFYNCLKEPVAQSATNEQRRSSFPVCSYKPATHSFFPSFDKEPENSHSSYLPLQTQPSQLPRSNSPSYSISSVSDSEAEPNHQEEWRDAQSVLLEEESGSKTKYHIMLIGELENMRKMYPDDPSDDIQLLKKKSGISLTKDQYQALEKAKTPSKPSTLKPADKADPKSKVLYINDKRVPAWASDKSQLKTRVTAQIAFGMYKTVIGKLKPVKQLDLSDFFDKKLVSKTKR